MLPTRHDKPVLLQPPLLMTSANTWCAVFLGARAHKATVVITHPRMWDTNATNSTAGSNLVPNVLNMTVMSTKAICITQVSVCQCKRVLTQGSLTMTKVICQELNVKSGRKTSMMDSSSVCMMKALPAAPTSQAVAEVHPAA